MRNPFSGAVGLSAGCRDTCLNAITTKGHRLFSRSPAQAVFSSSARTPRRVRHQLPSQCRQAFTEMRRASSACTWRRTSPRHQGRAGTIGVKEPVIGRRWRIVCRWMTIVPPDGRRAGGQRAAPGAQDGDCAALPPNTVRGGYVGSTEPPRDPPASAATTSMAIAVDSGSDPEKLLERTAVQPRLDSVCPSSSGVMARARGASTPPDACDEDGSSGVSRR